MPETIWTCALAQACKRGECADSVAVVVRLLLQRVTALFRCGLTALFGVDCGRAHALVGLVCCMLASTEMRWAYCRVSSRGVGYKSLSLLNEKGCPTHAPCSHLPKQIGNRLVIFSKSTNYVFHYKGGVPRRARINTSTCSSAARAQAKWYG